MDHALPSLKPVLRRLWKTPGFTVVTILTLALGLGANSAIFSVVSSVLLEPLPYRDAERLVSVWHTAPGLNMPQFEHSEATYLLYRQNNHSFDDLAVYAEQSSNVTGEGEPARIPSAATSASLFPVLGVQPMLGRLYREDEELPGAEPVVLISERAWKQRFGGAPAVLESTLQVDGVARRVIGVLPADFRFPAKDVELWLPLEIDPAKADDDDFNYSGIARLKPGVTVAAAKAELDPLLLRLPELFPGDLSRELLEKAQMKTLVRPLADDVVGDVGTLLWILLGSVGLILLIACANVANLFLVRAEGRAKEVAVRTALGAGRRQIALSSLLESLVLTVAAGLLGLLLARLGLEALVALDPGSIPRLDEIGIDGRALAFTAALSLACGLVFGVFPALRQGDARINSTLRDGSRGATVGRERHRARNVLVASQLALALVLAAGSALMLKSFTRLAQVDPGFDPAGVLTFRVALNDVEYRDAASVERFYTQVLDGLRALPGVTHAGAASSVPLTNGSSWSGMAFEDYPRAPNDLPPIVPNLRATPGYFEAMGIEAIEGRLLAPSDAVDKSGALVVSETFAKKFFPGKSALGKRMQPGLGDGENWLTIVGVVADVRHEALTKAPVDLLYYPVTGRDGGAVGWLPRVMSIAVKARVAPESLAAAARQAVWAVDPKVPIANLRTMDAVTAASMARTRFTMLLLSIAAGAALLLGAVGIYGVISYLVSQRTREIGVRMALGAARQQVVRMVLAQGLGVAAAGVALGLAASFVLMRWMKSLLFEVQPTDPPTLAAVAVVLLAVSVAATYLPARRAAAVEPVDALGRE